MVAVGCHVANSLLANQVNSIIACIRDEVVSNFESKKRSLLRLNQQKAASSREYVRQENDQ